MADLPSGSRIVGSTWRYSGERFQGLRGCQAVIVAVHRGTREDKFILTHDAAIGGIQPGDVIEFAPVINGRESRVGLHVAPRELEWIDEQGREGEPTGGPTG